jgi:transmembrane sensor
MTQNDKNNLHLLLEKQQQGICTAEESEMLQQWFEQTGKIDELTFISGQEKEEIQKEIKARIFEQIQNGKTDSSNPRVQRFRPGMEKRLISSAAAVVFLLISAALVLYFTRLIGNKGAGNLVQVTAPKGRTPMLITLPDESQVWLAPGSTLEYPDAFEDDSRVVSLKDGQAFFSVKRDKSAPFSVQTGNGITTKVLGTSFNVKAYKELDKVQVSVATGLVQVDNGKVKLEVLSPGESISYSIKEKTYTKEIRTPEDIMEWKSGEVHLSNAPIEEVAVTLNSLYDVRFSYDKEAMKTYRFNLRFSNKLTLNQVLSMLERINGIEYDLRKNEVIISNRK